MRKCESRPAGQPGGHKITDEAIEASLEQGADFDLLTCTSREFSAFLAGYRTGLHQATEAADRRRDQEDAAVYALAVRNVHALANVLPWDEHREAVARRTFEAGRRNRLAVEERSA